MLALISLVTGPAGKYLLGAVAAVALAGLGVLWVDSHDAALQQQWAAQQQTAVDAAVAKERAAADLAVKQAQDAAEARVAATEAIQKEIARVPLSSACFDSRAVGDALDGLYGAGSGAGKAKRPAHTP